ncbi:MAG: hypothetical protein MJ025_06845, partial [Victivallaceae bacterium]|nr:hypothetical protein [Victivallaceae bacterium]
MNTDYQQDNNILRETVLAAANASVGVVTVDGGTDTVVINNVTYTGTKYSQSQIAQALSDNSTVAARGISCSASLSVSDSDKILVVEDISICGGSIYLGDGGAIDNAGTISIYTGTFTDNYAYNGGAIYNAGVATIVSSYFGDNTATYGGSIDNEGDIYVIGCTFAGSTYTHILTYGTATLTNCIFFDNLGGCIANRGIATITGNTFAGNYDVYGGVVSNSGTATFSNSTFSNNEANSFGGAIYNKGMGTFSACIFSGNSASLFGAAICNINTTGSPLDTIISVDGCTFSGNISQSGGAIANNAVAMITNCVFATETDTIDNEGAMYIGGTIWTAANITSVIEIFVEAETELVLDISVYDETMTTELLTDYDTMFNTFQQNLAITINVGTNQAVGAYVLATGASGFDTSKVVSVICGETEIGSFKLESGMSSFLVEGFTYSLSIDDDQMVLEILAPSIGIVTADGGTDTVVIDDVTYTGKPYARNDIQTALDEMETVVAQDVSHAGTGLVAGSGVNKVFIADGIEIADSSAGTGGAIYNAGTAKITGNTISGNAADLGGAIGNDGGTATISNNTFANNNAGTCGGAIYNTSGTVYVTDNCFSGNTANAGGAIGNDGGTATISGNTFANNNAGTGGAIYNSATATIYVTDNCFSGNTANAGGA